eukprot:CAMPEP_0197045088 /NCGR_PEP_ID=MMETSP1384-20130603/21024_1 /TAXON_ID=29189 /ORGANISM="Ammonia sp." /LENGTH=85 /DNA_ID=CAMNT_0042476649 /DNA_START=235 /DNA_END=492 /DNA_ORIENTATION=-
MDEQFVLHVVKLNDFRLKPFAQAILAINDGANLQVSLPFLQTLGIGASFPDILILDGRIKVVFEILQWLQRHGHQILDQSKVLNH